MRNERLQFKSPKTFYFYWFTNVRFVDNFKGEVRVQNNLSSNERLSNAYLPHKVLNLHVKSNSRNKAINVRKFAYIAAAMITSLRTCDHGK